MASGLQTSKSVSSAPSAQDELHRPQRTLSSDSTFSGIGFVSGSDATLRFCPAPVGSGLTFVRTDLHGQPRIDASLRNLLHNDRRTAIGSCDAAVEMTEHVLAALAGLGIDNAVIEINAGETPAADGSSLPFIEVIDQAGIIEQDGWAEPIVISRPLRIEEGDASIEIQPVREPVLRITYELNYSNPGIGHQRYSVTMSPDAFRREIAAARTFVLEQEVEMLRSIGIGHRHTAKDLLIFRDNGEIIDNELRFPLEAARHKILDIVGDLALLGRPVIGEIIACRTGHRHNTALARLIQDQSVNETSPVGPM